MDEVIIGASDERMRRRGQDAVIRDFPEPGKEAAVVRLIFGGRITVGDMDDDDCWREGYDYETFGMALSAILEWCSNRFPEPVMWVRHIPSYRRRPGGDARKEYVAP